MMIERRSLLIGLGALFAAPAIVKASSLMKIAPTSVIRLPRNKYLILNPLHQITREAVELWTNSDAFIKEIDAQYDKEFAEDYAFLNGEQWIEADGTGSLPKGTRAKIGDTLRIRLPSLAYVTINPDTQLISLWDRPPVSQIPDQLALAAVAVAAVPVLLEKPVTRRFWNK